jgi:hypothetical protein
MALVKIEDKDMMGEIVTINDSDTFEYFPCYTNAGYHYVFITDGFINRVIVPFDEITLPDPALDNFTRVVDATILTAHNLPEGQP